jgi:hypothetical protein
MTDLPDDPFERLLRSGLGRHAADAPDDPDLTGVRVRAARYRRRRIVEAAGFATTALVVAVALVFVVGSSSGAPTTHQAVSTVPHVPSIGPVTGSLVLPLTGTAQADGLGAETDAGGLESRASGAGEAGGGTGTASKSMAPFAAPSASAGGGASGDQSVDVPPGTGQTLDRLSTHVSPDGVIVSVFYAPGQAYPVYQSSGPPVGVAGSPPIIEKSGSGESGSGVSGSAASGSAASPPHHPGCRPPCRRLCRPPHRYQARLTRARRQGS